MSEKTKATFSVSAVIFSILLMIECLFLYDEYPVYMPVLGIITTFLCALICVIAIQQRKETIFKITFLSLVFGCLAMAIFLGLLKTGGLEIIQNEDGLAELMGKAGVWGPIAYILIQFLQVTFVPIPSALTVLAGMSMFSIPEVVLYSTIGMIIGSMFAFFLGRAFGVKLVVWMVGAKTYYKYQKMLKGRDKMMLFLMFLFPVFPDDLLCMFAGVLGMSYGTFFIMQIITRPIGITVTCLSAETISFIPFDTWWGILIWIILGVGLCVMMFAVWKYSSRLEKYMVTIISKHFGTNSLAATVDISKVTNEVQNLISNTIIDDDLYASSNIINTKLKYKAKRYFANYKD